MPADFGNAVKNIQKMDQRSIDNAKEILKLKVITDIMFQFMQARISADADLLKIIGEAIKQAKTQETTP